MLNFALILLFTSNISAFYVPCGQKSSHSLNAFKIGEKYEPKWKKKETLGGDDDGVGFQSKGLIGTVPVLFKEGNQTLSTMAIVGQPLSDVASQAGQFIKYSCKKGECGTCECKMDGKWVRPCVATVPADVKPGRDLVIEVKKVKNKGRASGKFYSARSFVMGFYNNAIGMIGFVQTRRQAQKNWDDRQEYEELIRVKTIEHRTTRLERERMQKLKP